MAEYLKYKYLVGTPSSNYLKIIYGNKTSLIYTYIPNYDIDKHIYMGKRQRSTRNNTKKIIPALEMGQTSKCDTIFNTYIFIYLD